MNHLRVSQKIESTKRVLYIMSNHFRVRNNHALYYALSISDELDIILFKEPEDNPRNNRFFRSGIASYKEVLSSYSNHIRYIENQEELLKICESYKYIVKDKGYLSEEKAIEQLLQKQGVLSLVESNVIVPSHVVSNKEEYSAKTLRSKVWRHLPDFMDGVLENEPMFTKEQEAMDLLTEFLETKLHKYDLRSDPSNDVSSKLSVYLKYGFISPLTIYKEALKYPDSYQNEFFEQLLVRRDLAINFVEFNSRYNQFDSITYEWAYQTMEAHKFDNREYIYTLEDYINCRTHDPYFNAAMKEMIFTGYMHNYMRMYWCKKIIEWSKTYQEAYDTAIYLNNYYFLDGNTPNGYTGVAWCFGKHDRAWTERPIFGKLRYMNSNGLKRKFNIEEYVLQVEQKVGE